MTTVQGVTAAVQGIEALRDNEIAVMSLQELESETRTENGDK